MIEIVMVAICPRCGGCHSKRFDDNDLATERWLADIEMRGYTVEWLSVAEANAIFSLGCNDDESEGE